VDSGYCPIPCRIPEGSQISECGGAWEFQTPEFPESGKYRDKYEREEVNERMS